MTDSVSLLVEGLRRLGIPREPEGADRILRYLTELETWKDTFGLVKAEGEDLLVRHILDSLSGLSVVRRYPVSLLADLGSGGGLPGIPLALCLPDLPVRLIERSGKKAGFLRSTVPILGLAGRVEVMESDASSIRETFDGVVFRAFSRLDETSGVLAKILAPGGHAFAYKGRMVVIREELRGLSEVDSPLELVSIEPIRVPFLEEERHLVVLRRTEGR